MEDKVICEKCGAEMVPLDPSRPIGMECPNCDWGWATTYIEPILADDTKYLIFLEWGNTLEDEVIKAVAKVAVCNFLQAKKLLEEAPVKIAEGKARYVEPLIEMLEKAAVKYHIEPEWPYGVSYEERAAAKLKEADQKVADGTTDYYTAEEIRGQLEAVIEKRKK